MKDEASCLYTTIRAAFISQPCLLSEALSMRAAFAADVSKEHSPKDVVVAILPTTSPPARTQPAQILRQKSQLIRMLRDAVADLLL